MMNGIVKVGAHSDVLAVMLHRAVEGERHVGRAGRLVGPPGVNGVAVP